MPGADFLNRVSLEQRIGREAELLAQEFMGIFNKETMQRYMWESLRAFEKVRLTEFAHIFARCFARERLMALAQAQGKIAKAVPEVLYVCVHNAGRSQMAAALTAHLGGSRVHVRSAGSTPASEINRTVAQAMAELGLDVIQASPGSPAPRGSNN